MELDYSGMFRNRLIEPGEYMARVVRVRAVALESGGHAIEAEVVLDNNESQFDGTRLIAILQPTAKGQRYIEAFEESYRVSRASLQQAVGRWAAIYLYEGQYKGSVYGAVKFHFQPAAARAKAAELEALAPRRRAARALVTTPNGLLEWDEVADDSAAD